MTASDRRPIAPIVIDGLMPGVPATKPPVEMWVDPSELLVDPGYQRDLSERSLRLIRRIVETWDWRRFKPPICAMTDAGLEVVDGQHSATAAASHPGIEKIPVMVIDATEQASRAGAFVGHNRDRLSLTPGQLHAAAVIAGDEDALTIEQVTSRAGVRVLRVPPSRGDYQPGDTQAISSVATLINRRGAMRARVVLELLAKAGLTPVSANDIRAADHLMHSDEFGGWFAPEALTKTIADMRGTSDQEAKVFAATHCVPRWRGLASVWFKNVKKVKARIQAVEVLEGERNSTAPEDEKAPAESLDDQIAAHRPESEGKQAVEAMTSADAHRPSVLSKSRITDWRTFGPVNMGEPPPGRSALDQRRAEEAAKTGGRR